MSDFTEADVLEWHRTLYKACGLPETPPSPNDKMKWGYAMAELGTLAETEGGPFSTSDIIAAVSYMREQNRKGQAGWSLRPSKIILDPATLRDVVLQARNALKLATRTAERRSAPQAQQQLPNGTTRLLDEPQPGPGELSLEDAGKILRELRKGAAK